MPIRRSWVLLLACSAVLASCKNDSPKGQVVARVYGDEVTETMLAAEMGGAPRDPAAQKQARAAALEHIITRMVVAHAARDHKLDKTPEYAIQLKRGTDELQANLFEKSVAQQVPQPSPDEVQSFLDQHPLQFAERKIYLVEQIQALVSDPKQAAQIGAQTSFEGAMQMLAAANAPMQRSVSTVDPLRIAPQLTEKLATLAPGQMIVGGGDRGVQLIRVVQVQPAPITGAAAQQAGQQILRQQRQREAVAKSVKALVNGAAGEIKRKTAS
jgi:EpsD family peptidyl-prolyl cis-trans isomerase